MVAVRSVVHGTVAAGFEAVHDEFQRNFSERGELGAACAVYYKGEKVVDLWGGIRNKEIGELWQEDTMVLVFSSTKGIASMAVAVAHSQGVFDYDERVATYWSEFAQNGKENVTVRQLLTFGASLMRYQEFKKVQCVVICGNHAKSRAETRKLAFLGLQRTFSN